MGGVVAGGATLYVPRELPQQDKALLREIGLEYKVGDLRTSTSRQRDDLAPKYSLDYKINRK